MAEAIIGPLVGRLQSLHELAVGEALALVAVNDDIQRLRDRLMWLQAFLREADARRRAVPDEITKVWLLQTRDAVFDAEDALDHFYLYLKVDMFRVPRWARRSVYCLATFTKQASMRRNLSGKIKAINLRLEEIIQNKDKYKIDQGTDKEEYITWKASASITYTHRNLEDLPQQHLTMHVEERKKLVKALTTAQELEKGDCRPVVISVFGKSGAGKTTLVRNVYKEMERTNHFDIQAIESFGPYLTAANILHQIVQQLTDDNENCPRSMFKKMLGDKLRNKRYLLVIDGEVTVTEWKNILTILGEIKAGAAGNRIVHITQHEPQEPSSSHHVPIRLNTLQKEATIELFNIRLKSGKEVKNQDHTKYHAKICTIMEGLPLAGVLLSGLLQTKESGEKEVKNQDHRKYHAEIRTITEGLPLAVVLLSGLLQTKESGEWELVFKYLRSKKTKRLDSILTLCFDDLPNELKSCFLYFAALPTNTTIEAQNLVCMWMAEGFLRPMVGVTLEEVGYIYLYELIARNLVNLVHMQDDSNPGSNFVSIQNIVHDFLRNEAHEESFLEVHKDDDIPTLTSARRLSLQNYTDKYAALANPLPKLRSIFSQFEQEPKEEQENMPRGRKRAIFKKKQEPREENGTTTMKTQRGISNKKEDIRSHLQELLHGSEFLRVINLQGIEIGEKLPRAIRRVVRLQYLGITSCSLKKIPRSIGSLTSLQTLDVRETSVRELPQTFWMIKTLRHVFCFALKLPKQVGSLKLMQTLNSIELDPYEQGLHDTLGKMIHLENLFVWGATSGNTESLSNAISMLEYLRTLALHGDKIPSTVFTTISLRRLRYMMLQGELEVSSDLAHLDVISSCLPNLIELSLKETKVSQWFITKLAELPSLVTLALYAGSYKDIHLSISSGGFRRLKSIKLDVDTLRTLRIENGALPELKELDILSEEIKPKIIAEKRVMKAIV